MGCFLGGLVGTALTRAMAERYNTYEVHCSDGTFYTGWTVDPERRLRAHNAGRGARYTRRRRPVCLVHVERHASRAEAMQRERAIKRMTHAAKLSLVSLSSACGEDHRQDGGGGQPASGESRT